MEENYPLECSRYLLFVTRMILISRLIKRKRKRYNRRWWVRPMLRDRESLGHFHNLFQFMKNNDDEQFFKYTRMTVQQFEKLLHIVKSKLMKHSHRKPLSPEHRLAITL